MEKNTQTQEKGMVVMQLKREADIREGFLFMNEFMFAVRKGYLWIFELNEPLTLEEQEKIAQKGIVACKEFHAKIMGKGNFAIEDGTYCHEGIQCEIDKKAGKVLFTLYVDPETMQRFSWKQGQQC